MRGDGKEKEENKREDTVKERSMRKSILKRKNGKEEVERGNLVQEVEVEGAFSKLRDDH